MPKTFGETVKKFMENYRWVEEKRLKAKKEKAKGKTARTAKKAARKKK